MLNSARRRRRSASLIPATSFRTSGRCGTTPRRSTRRAATSRRRVPEAEAVRRDRDRSDFTQMTSAGVPAPDIVRLASRVVDGRVAQAEGDYDNAAAAFRDAVAIQDGLPCMEPPYWYYRFASRSGRCCCRPAGPWRLTHVPRGVREHPNSAWALFGLKEAQRAQGNATAAAQRSGNSIPIWEGGRREITLSML